MLNFKVKFSLLSIRSKIIIAFLFGCLMVIFAWIIAQIVFKETFNTIEVISKPNPKLTLVNNLFQKIQRLDYSQKVQALKVQDKSFATILDESKPIIQLLDTLKTFCTKDSLQLVRIQRMQTLLYERDELFLNYLKFRYGIIKNNPLSKDIQNLSLYISQNLKKNDSNFVKTTRKNTTTTTLLNVEDPEKNASANAVKKESFFKRVFSKKKNKEEKQQPAVKLVTEDVQETIDTFAVTQRDSFMKDMERAIVSIEKHRFDRRNTLVNHELKLAAASTIFVDELEQLLRQFQSEEIHDLQANTESLSGVFNDAFYWVEIILCLFLLMILTLILLIFSDISRSQRTKLQLIEAKERAEYLEQVKHRFLANMSHEIRTPLQAIIGYSEQVKEETHPQKKSLDAIHRSSEHLLQIVNEVLDYSRIVSGKFAFEKQDFNMSELIAEVAEIMEGQAETKNILFKLKNEMNPDTFYSGDSFRLKQILFNLLGNAIKFTDRGEVSFSVHAKDVGSKKTEFVFEIQDTGVGITEEELKRIFNSFEQAGENIQRQYGGTGLGLSIAKKLIDMQGGNISVSSEKHKGSKFTVKLIYLKSSEPGKQQLANQSKHQYEGKVLVVDDDAFILQLCSTILSKNKIEHVCYASSEKVLEDPWDKTISMALIDIRMPRINGVELYRRLKDKIPAGVKSVALTAQALPEEKEAILKEGFDKVLLKPFREKELLQLFEIFSLQETKIPLHEDKLDLSSIKIMCMGDEALFKETLALLIKETESDLFTLKKAVDLKDYTLLAEITHKLSSKIGQMGLYSLSHRLRIIEKEIRENKNYSFSESEHLEFIKDITAVIENLKTYPSIP